MNAPVEHNFKKVWGMPCVKCGAYGYVMPLHGERGGPPYCPLCAGAWHAAQGPRRRARRIVIKAMRGYLKAGGNLRRDDLAELSCAAGGFSLRADDAAAARRDDFADLTSELLNAAIALTHPDKHPPERKAEATRVTQELLALKPFVFPAPPPEPPPKPCDGSINSTNNELNKPSQPDYPCEDCRHAAPAEYCIPCKAQYDKEQEDKRERKERERAKKNARQRELYKWRLATRLTRSCATCGEGFKPTRSDRQYCSPACRQRAYLKRDGHTSNAKPLGREQIERAIESAFRENLASAFTTDQLCELVYPGLNRIERKHRAVVVPIARKISERLGEHRKCVRAEQVGRPFVFFNKASVMSYAMGRWKGEFPWCLRYTDEEFKADFAPGGREHRLVVEGGYWWQHCQKYKNCRDKKR
jgi:hypothetical protein